MSHLSSRLSAYATDGQAKDHPLPHRYGSRAVRNTHLRRENDQSRERTIRRRSVTGPSLGLSADNDGRAC
jgi:hypothetical protein